MSPVSRPRTVVRHPVSIIAVLLAAVVAGLLGAVVSPATAAPDPSTCEGYPEERVFLEGQAWWMPTLNGTENFGHVHAATCFPRTHNRDGTVNKVSGTIRFDVRIMLFHNPGELRFLRVHLTDPKDNHQAARVDINQYCVKDGPNWSQQANACVWWVPIEVDTTVAHFDGFQEFRIGASVRQAVASGSANEDMFNSTGFQAWLDNGNPVEHYRSNSDGSPREFIEGRGWYEGADYTVARLEDRLPYQVSGTWEPFVQMRPGAGGKDVHRSIAAIDPSLHHGDEGTVILDEPGPYRGHLRIDTTTLPDGPHHLLLRAHAPCDGTEGNDCGLKPDGSSQNVATSTGVLVLRFTVNNGVGHGHEAESPTITLPDDAADGAVTIVEGQTTSLTITVHPPDAEVTWDLDGDGDCNDATGTTVELIYRTRGPHPVTICADDGTNTATQVLSVVVRDPTTTSTVLFGTDRIATALATSRDTFADRSADAVVLARADVFADALAGTALAVRANAPLLLTGSGQLPDEVLAEIDRVLVDSGTVYLLGGPAALSPAVANSLTGREPVRLAGATRYDTAAAIANAVVRLAGAPDTILVARGDDFPDGLAAGTIASAARGVVVLSAGDTPTDHTDRFLAAHPHARAVAVGGQAATAYPDADPIVGANRYATAVALANEFLDNPVQVGLARGDDFPDAMTGGVHIGRLGGALLLTRPDHLPDHTDTYLCSNAPTLDIAYAYGGPHAITPDVVDRADHVISGLDC